MKISFAELRKKFYFRIPVAICIGILLFYTAGVLAMDKILLPGNRSPKAGNLTLNSKEAALDVFFHRGEPGKPVILYSHGNGEYLAAIMPLLKSFISRGYSVMAYDYAGYGNSTGYPGEKQAYSDIETVFDYLTGQQKISPEDIVVMGYSVGSGPSCYIAEKYPVKALVIISGFASAAQVLLPFSVPFDKFPNAERLKNCKIPLMVIHGRSDKIVPIRNGRKLIESSIAPLRRMHEEDAGHNDIFYRTTGFFHKLETFLADVERLRQEFQKYQH